MDNKKELEKLEKVKKSEEKAKYILKELMLKEIDNLKDKKKSQ